MRNDLTWAARFSGAFALALLAACSQQPATAPGGPAQEASAGPQLSSSSSASATTKMVADSEAGSEAESSPIPRSIHAVGTEPFWSARVKGQTLIWSTPEQPDGLAVPIRRMVRGGVMTVEGVVGGRPLRLEVRPDRCSDGMSDTVYPLSVVRKWGSDTHQGCARGE